MSTSEFIQNSALLIGFITVVYFAARSIARVGDFLSARKLAPFAPVIGGSADPKRGVLRGTHRGRAVEVAFSPKHTAGSDDAATHFKAFHVRVLNSVGKSDWWLRYHVSGALGQGPKRLVAYAHDPQLAARLRSSGIVEEVEAVNAGMETYVAVRFESFSKVLTYTDDVSPRTLPTLDTFKQQLEIAVRVAAVNEELNR